MPATSSTTGEGRSKPRLKQIVNQVKMADWRGGRGRGRAPFPDQWYQPHQYYQEQGFQQGYRQFRPPGLQFPTRPPGQGQHQSGQPAPSTQGPGKAKATDSAPKKDNATKVPPADPKVIADPNVSYVDVVCYNCGIPGHHKAKCTSPKICFICRGTNHALEECPIRKQDHKVARYI